VQPPATTGCRRTGRLLPGRPGRPWPARCRPSARERPLPGSIPQMLATQPTRLRASRCRQADQAPSRMRASSVPRISWQNSDGWMTVTTPVIRVSAAAAVTIHLVECGSPSRNDIEVISQGPRPCCMRCMKSSKSPTRLPMTGKFRAASNLLSWLSAVGVTVVAPRSIVSFSSLPANGNGT
jgi:hypothetical protein